MERPVSSSGLTLFLFEDDELGTSDFKPLLLSSIACRLQKRVAASAVNGNAAIDRAMSQRRTMPGGRVIHAHLPKGPEGRALCRWCGVEVQGRRRTFCSDVCVHEWRLRTDPGYLREQVFARDRGRCALCHIDAVEALRRLRRSRGSNRKIMLSYWGMKSVSRKSLWDADHILPVCEGGGECDLENIRTLCLACHKDVTYRLHIRLRKRDKIAY